MSCDNGSSDSHQSSSSTSSAPKITVCCTLCNKRKISQSFCTTCKRFLCEDCTFFHGIMVRFNSHRILHLDNVEDVLHLERILQNGEQEAGISVHNSVLTMRRALENQFLRGTENVNRLLKLSYDFNKSEKMIARQRAENLENVNRFQPCQQVLNEQEYQIGNMLDNEHNSVSEILSSYRKKIDHVVNDMLVTLSDLKLVLEDNDGASGFDYPTLFSGDSVDSSLTLSSFHWQFDFGDVNLSVAAPQNFNWSSEQQLTDAATVKNVNRDHFPYESFNVPSVASEPCNLDVNPDLTLSTTDPDSPPFANFVNSMQIYTTFGQKGNGSGMFNSPHGFCLGVDEDIVVADSTNHRVQIFNKTGAFKFQFGVPGRHDGNFWYPRKVAFLPTQRRYVVCDRGYERSRMQIFTETGQFIKKIHIQYIDIVAGIAVTPNEDIVLVNSVTPTVFIIGQNDFLRSIDCAPFMDEPSDVAVVGKELYICDFKGHCVVVIDDEGNALRKFGSKRTTMFPNGIDVSPKGYVFIGDSHGNFFHVVVYTLDGTYVSEFRCPYVKVSRCCGLKVTSDGRLVTVDKNYHHVIMLEDVHINNI